MNSAYGGLRPEICPSSLASSGLETCDALFKYVSDSSPCGARRHGPICGLATQFHKLSWLVDAACEL
jgi:hypothetical protein